MLAPRRCWRLGDAGAAALLAPRRCWLLHLRRGFGPAALTNSTTLVL
jgi:hypothetical protein